MKIDAKTILIVQFYAKVNRQLTEYVNSVIYLVIVQDVERPN